MKKQFAIAKRLSRRHPDRGNADAYYQLCAVLFDGSRVINYGYNRGKSNPLGQKLILKHNIKEKYSDSNYKELPTVCATHAEMSALSTKSDKGNILVISRISKGTREFGCARPCNICMELIKEKGIKHVYYTNDQGNFEKVDF